jgi:hypothetical protein
LKGFSPSLQGNCVAIESESIASGRLGDSAEAVGSEKPTGPDLTKVFFYLLFEKLLTDLLV